MSDRILIWLLIENQGAALLARRKPDQPPLAGQWTLPGAEMAASDSASEVVSRFASSQLGVQVSGEDFVDTFFVSEAGVRYAVNVFKPRFSGQLRYRESGPFAEVQWVFPDALDSVKPAPEPLVEMLRGKRHWQAGDDPAGQQAS